MSGRHGVAINDPAVHGLSDMLEFVNGRVAAGEWPEQLVKIAFLRNFTIEGIEPFLKFYCFKSGLNPDVMFGNYDMMRQDVMDNNSCIHVNTPDIIVAAQCFETFLPDGWRGNWHVADVMNELSSLYLDMERNTEALIIINTFVPPFHTDFGIAAIEGGNDVHGLLQQLNQCIRDFVHSRSSRFVLIDWERIVRLLGENESMDYRFWFMSKAPFKKSFLEQYALEITKVARALKGKAKKCLVLDCDNTLWGGVVGEEGIDGIKLDRHTYPGNVFHEFQKKLLKLHDRGVLLALCSKNNEQDVLDVFDGHQGMLIRREHLVAWRINWNDKAANLRSLATELNLGLDSFVFVDDSPAECELVRDLLPDVTVVQVPDKLYLYPPVLDRLGLFDTLTYSDEDRQRSLLYRSEAQRKGEQARFDTINEYLASLSIVVTVHAVQENEIARVAQLTQKTNQFNLTTRRYSDCQISSLCHNLESAVISLSVRDRFGASGLTGVLIAHYDNGVGSIDSLLLSCRILGRNIETVFVLKALEIMEQRWGVSVWKAEYVVSAKNQQVASFWPRIGFMESGKEDGRTYYELPAGKPRRESIPYISIEE